MDVNQTLVGNSVSMGSVVITPTPYPPPPLFPPPLPFLFITLPVNYSSIQPVILSGMGNIHTFQMDYVEHMLGSFRYVGIH